MPTIRFVTVGKTLAFTRVNFYDQKNTLIARGSHTKLVHSHHSQLPLLAGSFMELTAR